MKLSVIEIKLLSVLLASSRGLDAYTLFRRVKAPFPDFTRAIISLTEDGFINESKSDFYIISSLGRQNISLYSSKKKIREWRQVPAQFTDSKLNANELYIPSIRRLDKKAFKNCTVELVLD